MNKAKNYQLTITILAWVVVLLWMLLIFNLSSQVAEDSNKLSKGVTKVVTETAERVVPGKDFDINRFNPIVRKNAHFFAYLVLGIFVMNALRRSRVYRWRSLLLALGICALYAISDEVHQLFVAGRGGQVKDVFIDSTGAFVGIGLYNIILSRRKQRI